MPRVQLDKAGRKAASKGGKKGEFTKSSKVFAMITAHQDGSTAAAAAKAAAAAAPQASHLKL